MTLKCTNMIIFILQYYTMKINRNVRTTENNSETNKSNFEIPCLR